MRTLITSDAHGDPALITNALEHAGFRPGHDRFVYAGDLVDRGPDGRGCIDLVDRYASEVLLGNHDVAALLGDVIYPQNPETPALRPLFLEKVLGGDRDHAWKLATCVEGVLITHAGVSSAYEPLLKHRCHGDPALLAAHLNTAFLRVLERRLVAGSQEENGILGDAGPLWFRPRPYSDLLPLAGVTQVVGHTPPVPGLERPGFYQVDPGAYLGLDDPGRFRYAVIEDGRVRVVDGSLGRDCRSGRYGPGNSIASHVCV